MLVANEKSWHMNCLLKEGGFREGQTSRMELQGWNMGTYLETRIRIYRVSSIQKR